MRLRSAAMLLFAALLALAGIGAAPALAAPPYPPAAVVCSISPNPVAPGAGVVITCSGYKPGTTVTISVVKNGVVTHSTAVVAANGTLAVTEQAGPKNGPSTFQVAGTDSNGDPAARQVTTKVQSNNGNGNGKGNGKGNGTGTGNANGASCTVTGTLSSASATVGQTVTFGGGGFAPGATVLLTDSAGNDLGSTQADGKGTFSAPISEAQPGSYTVYGSGAGGGACAGKPRTVVAGLNITRAEGAGLPFTGMDGLWLLLRVAIVLVTGGSGVVALERRRRLIRARV